MRLTKLILMVMVAGLVCILTSGMVLAKSSKDTIFVIGDSLSDPGNLYSLTGFLPPSPPYAQRFSNGPVWAEYVSMDRDVNFDNRAYGGAFSGVFVVGGVPVSNLNNVQYPGQFSTLLPGVAEEIDSLLADHPKGLNPKALYVIWVGPNDFMFGLLSGTLGAVLTQTAANIAEDVCRLGTAGARHFVVGNHTDFGLTPFARAQGPANQAFISQTIAQFNAGLAQALMTLPSACAETVQVWDTYQALRDITADPASFGLTNITDSCLTDTSICPNPAEYLFWDSVHPTTAVHEIIADQFASLVCAADDDDDDEMEGDYYKKHHHDKDDDFAGCWRED